MCLGSEIKESAQGGFAGLFSGTCPEQRVLPVPGIALWGESHHFSMKMTKTVAGQALPLEIEASWQLGKILLKNCGDSRGASGLGGDGDLRSWSCVF